MDALRVGSGPGLRTSGRPRIGIVGAGRVGTALGVAIDRAGWPVVGAASRDAARRARFQELVPGARAVPGAGEFVDLVDLILLAIPDDVIAVVAAGLRLGNGQAIVHTSGALPASILASASGGVALPASILASASASGGVAAASRGATVASFHPLVPFADVDGAVAALRGATIAIEGDTALVALLADLAADMGARPVLVSATGKAAYHAAAVLAAGGFVALLDAIAELVGSAGLNEAAALETYGPLVRAGLDNATRLGIAQALTGPFVRGDARTVRLHLDAIDRLAPATRALYVAAARRQIALAAARGDLDGDRATELEDLLDP